MSPRYTISHCCWCPSPCDGDLELSPAQARIADSPDGEWEMEKAPAATRQFGWAEVEMATGKFATTAVLGEGGSSTVYLARLQDSSLAAVKLNRPCERLHRVFRQELDVLLRLLHPHIVRLVGFCDGRAVEGALLFEYLPNGTLHEKLHGGGPGTLPWERRMVIAYQLAQALDYLHDGCDPQVVHGDVKAANVLLDSGMDAKLCDFGSAQVGFSAAVAPPRSAWAMMGSPGYVDPHYLRSGMVSKKSDVYSFGVLLLELVTGAEAFDAERERRLTVKMSPVLRDPEEQVAKAVDDRLGRKYDTDEAKEVLSMAAMCLGDNPSLRPSMAEVVGMLRDKTWASLSGPSQQVAIEQVNRRSKTIVV